MYILQQPQFRSRQENAESVLAVVEDVVIIKIKGKRMPEMFPCMKGNVSGILKFAKNQRLPDGFSNDMIDTISIPERIKK